MAWLDCPDCNDLLLRETCTACGDEPESREYTLTAEGCHFIGPMCPECIGRFECKLPYDAVTTR